MLQAVRKTILFAGVLIFSMSAVAESQGYDVNLVDQSLYNVVAPTTFGDISSGDRVLGQIYFDSTAGRFKGIAAGGSPVVLSTPVGQYTVSTSGTSQKIENALIGFTAGVPSIVFQSGSWISSVTDNGVGNVTLNVTGFSANTVTCTLAAVEEGKFVRIVNATSSAVQVTIVNQDGSTRYDGGFHIICMGPN